MRLYGSVVFYIFIIIIIIYIYIYIYIPFFVVVKLRIFVKCVQMTCFFVFIIDFSFSLKAFT